MQLSRSIRILLFLPAVIVIGFFYFPLQLRGIPMNTKTILAGLGVLFICVEFFKGKGGVIRKDLLVLSVFAIIMSFICYLAITLNNTSDNTYVTYIISMWVWLSAAYAAIYIVRGMYGKLTLQFLCDLLIAACLIQCVSALVIDMSVTVHDFVDRFVDHRWTESVNRFYGISCELDTAGIHFAVMLVMIAYFLGSSSEKMSDWKIGFYWLSFIVITVIGNMIARTTLAGTGLGLAYLAWKTGVCQLRISGSQKRVLKIFALIMVISLPVIIYYYNTNDRIYENIRFGFEGFFSLVEKGGWDVSSNNKLKTMVVFPENLKTWVIGDGYMINPKFDPYYIGPITKGYYMDTDIGYLRFIFYCGLPGLIVFSLFILKAGEVCAWRLPKYRVMVYVLVLLNFIVWMKVSTDLFFIFALLYSVDAVWEDEDDVPLHGKEMIIVE